MNKRFFILTILIAFCAVVGSGNALAQDKTKNGNGKMPVKEMPNVEETIKLETPTGNLHGTLLLPGSKKKVPVILLIAGSGPTDRDGNTPLGANNSLKMLAEGLAAQGIASLRYDKHGIGKSGEEMMLAAKKTGKMPREEDFNFNNFIDDAMLWANKLRGDKRFSAVTIAGHSEGSLIGMVAAKRMQADGFVSIAGAGRPAQQILLEQLRAQLPPDLMKSAADILNQLAAGKTIESVPPALNVVFRPSVQPYMISWLRYDPAKEIAGLKIPVLILQGTTDLQTTEQDAKSLAGANGAAKILFIDGMNHVLKTVPNDRDKQIASYSDPSLPVTTELVDVISRFVKKTK